MNEVRRILEEAGYEAYVFHANTEGGSLLEKFVAQGMLSGVADITLSEVSMPIAGSYQEPVPGRLEHAGTKEVPAVVVPGGLDMILIHKEEVSQESDRKVYFHTPEVVFARSNAEENKMFAETIAGKLNGTDGNITVMIPEKGVSMVDKEGGIFYEPETDKVLFDTLKNNLSEKIEVKEMACHINDPLFAREIAETLLNKMKHGGKKQ